MTADPSQLDPLDTAESAARQALAQTLRQTRDYLRSFDRSVPSDPELVHQLRVTTRRGGAAFAIFQSTCRHREHRRWTKRLKRIRQAAGRARDLDVLLEHQQQRSHPNKRVLATLRARRVVAQEPLDQLRRKWKRNSRWHRQQKQFERSLKRRACRGKSRQLWPQAARDALLDCVQRFDQLGRRSTRSIKDLHVFRIQAKQLRYTLEWMDSLLSRKKSRLALQHLKRIQNHLGAINDHCVAVELLSSSAGDGKGQSKLIRREQQRLKKSLALWAQWWTRKRQKSFCAEVRSLCKHLATPTTP